MVRTVYDRTSVVPLIAEAFREFGYDGATMSRITERTGLGKGSLYHFFPGGKDEMAVAVLAEVAAWFDEHIVVPLREHDPGVAIDGMWRAVEAYFHSGRRVCLVGAFALDQTRDRFAEAVAAYFTRWIDALAGAFARLGHTHARERAEDAVSGIQGAIVLSRALDDPRRFSLALARIRMRVAQA